jgi:hypothetical protein
MDHPAAFLARLAQYNVSKWVYLDLDLLTEPLEVYTRALGTMSDVIFAASPRVSSEDDVARIAKLIRSIPSVTSIDVPYSGRLPAIQRDTFLFINDDAGSNKIDTFLHDNQSQFARTRRTHIFVDTGGSYPSIDLLGLGLSSGARIAVSFFGPSSGSLILKLTHSFLSPVTLILNQPQGPRIFEYPVSSSLSTTTITFSPSPSEHLSFVPNNRNNLIIQVRKGRPQSYVMNDIRLHDEAGNDYNPASPEA